MKLITFAAAIYLIGICTAGGILLDKIKVEVSEEVQDSEAQEPEKLESNSVPAEVPLHFIQIKAGSEEVRLS
jgi:hypothetical protein